MPSFFQCARQLLYLWFINGANAFAVLTDPTHSVVLIRVTAADWTGKLFFLVVDDLEDPHLPLAYYANALPIADGT